MSTYEKYLWGNCALKAFCVNKNPHINRLSEHWWQSFTREKKSYRLPTNIEMPREGSHSLFRHSMNKPSDTTSTMKTMDQPTILPVEITIPEKDDEQFQQCHQDVVGWEESDIPFMVVEYNTNDCASSISSNLTMSRRSLFSSPASSLRDMTLSRRSLFASPASSLRDIKSNDTCPTVPRQPSFQTLSRRSLFASPASSLREIDFNDTNPTIPRRSTSSAAHPDHDGNDDHPIAEIGGSGDKSPPEKIQRRSFPGADNLTRSPGSLNVLAMAMAKSKKKHRRGTFSMGRGQTPPPPPQNPSPSLPPTAPSSITKFREQFKNTSSSSTARQDSQHDGTSTRSSSSSMLLPPIFRHPFKSPTKKNKPKITTTTSRPNLQNQSHSWKSNFSSGSTRSCGSSNLLTVVEETTI